MKRQVLLRIDRRVCGAQAHLIVQEHTVRRVRTIVGHGDVVVHRSALVHGRRPSLLDLNVCARLGDFGHEGRLVVALVLIGLVCTHVNRVPNESSRAQTFGLSEVGIFASGGLDEFEIAELLTAGAPIDGFGVGTKVGVSADAPWTDCAYKLVQYAGNPVLKLSTGKCTLPGPKQVFRAFDVEGQPTGDVIACADEQLTAGQEAVLETVMAGGRPTRDAERVSTLRTRFESEFATLPELYKRLRAPAIYPVSISKKLTALRDAVTASVRATEGLSG